MRPQELDVTLSLFRLDCKTMEEDGDEPYMWILGFKVDAETLGPPPPDSILPSLGVRVFQGPPHFRHVLPYDQETEEGKSYPIPPNLGTRSFRLKPALLPLAGWFPGLAGIVCLLWDQDGFAPSTSEAGYDKFKALFGPALSVELTSLINGGYDDPLSRDANGNIMPNLAGGQSLPWRLSRLGDPAGRKNAVKAITANVKDKLIGPIKDALKDEAGLDELLDPDDLLGVDAYVFLGDELSTPQFYSLTFTDDEADYTVQGHAFSSRVHLARLESIVTKVQPQIDRQIGIWRRVCWFEPKLYWAQAFRLQTTTRFELFSLLGDPPSVVRWFLNDTPLANGQGSVTVTFEPVDIYEGPPQDVLAQYYLGGPSLLTYNATGSALEVSNTGGDGVFFGTIKVLYAYAGDPSLFPPPATPINELLALGYDQEKELGIVAVDLQMGAEYKSDVRRCKRVVDDIDRKHIAVNFGKMKINPGDPPPFKQDLLDRVASAASLANAVGLDAVPQWIPIRSLSKREGS